MKLRFTLTIAAAARVAGLFAGTAAGLWPVPAGAAPQEPLTPTEHAIEDPSPSAVRTSTPASPGRSHTSTRAGRAAVPSEATATSTTTFEILVLGNRLAGASARLQPQAIGIATRADITRGEGLYLESALNLMPGVRLENRTISGGQRITIRGYGNATNFNGTGYKAYLNGIPITDAEGATLLDDIDVSTLGQIEVIKGPASSLYGAGIGGVVKMYTLTPEPGATRLTQELLAGSYALLRTNTRVEHATDKSAVVVNYGHQHSDGYRVHSSSTKDYVLLSADLKASSSQTLSIYAAANHSFEQLAGQLTEAQFLGRQNVAEPPYVANDGNVTVDSVRFGASHRYEFSRAVSNVTSAYASGYQLTQPFAVGYTANMAVNVGGRTELSLFFGGPGLGLAGITGVEVQQTSSFKKSYGLTAGVLGGLRGDLEVQALQATPFTQWDLILPYEFTLTAGASLNVVRYEIKDRLTNSANPTHANQSGVKSFSPVLAPRVALRKMFDRLLMAYAQVSFGYTPPSSGSVVIPQISAVNRDLKPERGILFEIGAKGGLFAQRFRYEVALFDLEVQDKLTPRAVTSTSGTVLYTLTTNAGSQSNRGLEVAAKYRLIDDERGIVSLFQPFAAYTLSSFRYDDFKSDNNNNARTVDYTGKKVVGVPAHTLNVGVDLALRLGIYLHGSFQYVDTVPLTYDNTQQAKSYSLLNAKIGYRAELAEHFQLDIYAGANNMLGSLYYTMVFLNASYAAAPPNVYLPGPYTASFYGGINLSYKL